MDISLLLEGYKYVANRTVLENYHYENINKVTNYYLVNKKSDDYLKFSQELKFLNKAYHCVLKNDYKLKSNYSCLILIVTNNVPEVFLRYYHNCLFVVDEKLIKKYEKIINNDCKIIYFKESLTNDGLFAYLMYNCLIVSNDVKHVNFFVNKYHKFKGMIGTLNHYGVDTACIIFDSETNLVINALRKQTNRPTTIYKLENYLKNNFSLSDYHKVLDMLFEIGYCTYQENRIGYLREFL